MAKPQNVLIGKTRGSVGDATFTSWKGTNVLKSKAVNNYSDPTSEQLQNNSKFGVMSLFAKQIAIFVLAGFRAMAVRMTEYNAFSKANPYSRVIGGTAPNYFVDPSEIKISQGPELPYGLTTVTKEASGANQIDIVWDQGTAPINSAPVFVAAFDSTTGELLASSAGTQLYGAGLVELMGAGLGTAVANTVIHIFYVNPVNGKACDSIIAPLA